MTDNSDLVAEYNRIILMLGGGKPLSSISVFDAMILWEASNPLNFGGIDEDELA